jgi:hypothetical protein
MDDIDSKLERLLNEFRKLAIKTEPAKKSRTILRTEEIRTWLAEEPSFNKPIVKRLSDGSYHTDSPDEDLTEPTFRSHGRRKTFFRYLFKLWIDLEQQPSGFLFLSLA